MARACPPWIRPLIPWLVVACATAAHAETPEQVPDPRRTSSGCVADVPGRLSSADRDSIQQTVAELRRDTGAEMLVVIIQRTDGRTPKEFTTRLFDRWGMSDSRSRAGILYLISLDDRRMEVETSAALGSEITPSEVDPLLVERVVPYFKQGDVSTGVRVGTEAIADLVRDTLRPSSAPVQVAGMQPPGSMPLAPPASPQTRQTPDHLKPAALLRGIFQPDPPIPSWSIILCWFALLMLLMGCRSGIDDEGFSCARSAAVLCLISIVMVYVEHRMQLNKPSAFESMFKFVVILLTYVTLFPWTGWTSTHTVISTGNLWVMGLYFGCLAGIVGAGMAIWGPPTPVGSLMHVPHGNHELQMMVHMGTFLPLLLMAGRLSRYIPPVCTSCNHVTLLLSEEADDAHLSPGERKEESLGSVDYDIWVCPGCSGKTKRRHAAWMTGYSTCCRCSFVTVSTSRETIRYATYDHSGEGRRTDTCLNCRHVDTSYYTIPRKTRSSSSSSSSRSSSGGGSRSSSRGGGGASW